MFLPTCTTQLIIPPLIPIQTATHHHSLHTSPSMFLGHCVASVHVMSIEMIEGNDRFCNVRTCCSSDRFSQRPLHRATNMWSQRPWTNALGGLYLYCLNRMLGRRWIDGRDEALRWYTSDDEKVAGDFPRPQERFSLQQEVALYWISL